MDRKKFLQLTSTGAMAGMALAAFPKVIRGKSQPVADVFIGTWSESEDMDIKLILYSEAIRDYDNAADYRSVRLKLVKNYYDAEGDYSHDEDLLNALYRFRNAPRLIDSEAGIYRAQADLSSVEMNEPNVPLSEITFEIQFRENGDKVGLQLAGRTIILEESVTFICTACMQAKGLGRDCKELKILRSFRNEYAMGSLEGRQLIREYAEVGPTLVNVIESSHNRDQMYAAVYETLVLPAIDLIHEGRKEAAMQFYKEYVKGLNKKLCRV
ncbi:MAG: hypothetical protein JXR26_03650 [Balneolaceae bacterium]|nr:hypothetical protein [Balneolaceae bacterium]